MWRGEGVLKVLFCRSHFLNIHKVGKGVAGKVKAVEHDCSVNGSEVGGWNNMDYNEGGDEEWGESRRRISDKRAKGNKRVRNEQEDGTESEEDGQITVQKEREEKYVVIIRFNEKNQGSINPLSAKVAKLRQDVILN